MLHKIQRGAWTDPSEIVAIRLMDGWTVYDLKSGGGVSVSYVDIDKQTYDAHDLGRRAGLIPVDVTRGFWISPRVITGIHVASYGWPTKYHKLVIRTPLEPYSVIGLTRDNAERLADELGNACTQDHEQYPNTPSQNPR